MDILASTDHEGAPNLLAILLRSTDISGTEGLTILKTLLTQVASKLETLPKRRRRRRRRSKRRGHTSHDDSKGEEDKNDKKKGKAMDEARIGNCVLRECQEIMDSGRILLELGSPSGHSRDLSLDPEAMSLICLLYTSPSPRDRQKSRMPSSA